MQDGRPAKKSASCASHQSKPPCEIDVCLSALLLLPAEILTLYRLMIKTEKPPVDLELRRRIQELIDYKGGGFNQDSVADIIENALKILNDIEDSGDVRVIKTAVRELRYAFRLFAPYSHTRKVTIFGSSRTLPARMEYQQAVEFGRKIAEAG